MTKRSSPTSRAFRTEHDFLKGRREILEGLFHQHMPHIEVPEYEPWYPPFESVPR
jgi:hypothetical protein